MATVSNSNGMNSFIARPKVDVIYHMFPHYRAGVMRALAKSEKYEFSFWGSHSSVNGIPAFTGDETVHVHKLGFRPVGSGGLFSGLHTAIFNSKAAAIVLIGNPNYPQTWSAALLARCLGKHVFFWSHGWLRKEGRLKRYFRNLYFGPSNGVLVYGHRARELAADAGFPANKVYPIYNSLDFDVSDRHYQKLRRERATGSAAPAQAEITPWPELPTFICTARLTQACRFDLLLLAMDILKREGNECSLLLVGEGPERARLERMAEEMSLKVKFFGAVYDEATLAPLIYASDMTISPGKVGLTAMHSLAYGTPVITHSDMDGQMPEVEAITSGVNGAFFLPDSAEDLAATIVAWLRKTKDREQVREACREPIKRYYNPSSQCTAIEAALDAAGARS